MFQLLIVFFKNTFNRSRITWEKVEDLKMEHCYIATDYASEARLFQVLTWFFLQSFSLPIIPEGDPL